MNPVETPTTLFLRPPKLIPVGPRVPARTTYLRVPSLFL